MLNEILGVAARFNQHLTRKFGVTGGAPSPQLTPEIAPVVNLESGAEAHVLQGEYLASGVIAVTGVVAKKSTGGLFNPVGSNLVLVTDMIEVSNFAAAMVLNAGVGKTGPMPILPAAGGVTYRETRVQVDPAGSIATKAPAGLVRGDNDPPVLAAFNPNVFSRGVLANTPTAYEHPIVLAPGWGVLLWTGSTGVNITFSFAWTEIPLAHGEVGPF